MEKEKISHTQKKINFMNAVAAKEIDETQESHCCPNCNGWIRESETFDPYLCNCDLSELKEIYGL